MIAILGDTHLPRGARRLPDACLQLLSRSDLIVHVGDFVAFAVLEELRGLAPVAAVHGNVDEQALRAELPERLVVEAAGRRLGLVHDPGPARSRFPRLRTRFPDCDVIAFGHTHRPELAEYEGTWIVNPGSPTERRRAPSHTMAVVRGPGIELVDLG
jgi:uncharacterized protein